MINAETKEIILELVDNRDANTLKNILEKHVLPGNIIVNDAWDVYFFLDDINSGYAHHVYNHGRGNFGNGLDSTSHIESIWSEIKSTIKNIYYSIHATNLVYHLREAEYRRNTKHLNNAKKLENFATIISIVGNGINDLLSFNYDTYFE